MGVEDIRGHRVSRNEAGWMGVGIIFGAQTEAPYFGTGGFSPALEEDVLLIFRKDSDGIPVKEDLAAEVAELANANKVVLEGRHDLAVAGGKGGQVEVGVRRRRRGGGVDAAGGVADMGCGGVRVDVAYGGGWSDVYVTGDCVGDGCVRDGNSRRGCRSTARRGGATARKIS